MFRPYKLATRTRTSRYHICDGFTSSYQSRCSQYCCRINGVRICWLKGAKRVIAVDYVNYRLQHAKRTNKVEIVNFEHFENVGMYLKEMTKGGADVVIDAVGMDGKMTDIEFLASGMKLQGGAFSSIYHGFTSSA